MPQLEELTCKWVHLCLLYFLSTSHASLTASENRYVHANAKVTMETDWLYTDTLNVDSLPEKILFNFPK